MIYDFGTEVTLEDPDVSSITYSDAFDLLGGNDGVPSLLGTGERLFMQFEVTTTFVGALGSPLVQFGVAISSTDPLGTDSHVLALTGGTINTKIGFQDTELTAGVTFNLPIPAWDDIIAETATWPHNNAASDLTTFRGLRYLGVLAHNPMVAGTDTFSAGQVKARIIKDPGGASALSNIYGSRMGVL